MVYTLIAPFRVKRALFGHFWPKGIKGPADAKKGPLITQKSGRKIAGNLSNFWGPGGTGLIQINEDLACIT